MTDEVKPYKPGQASDTLEVKQTKEERLIHMMQHFAGKDGGPRSVSSIILPDGLLVTFKTGEDARRFLSFMKSFTPDIMHVLYELHDTRVMLKNPPEWPNALPAPSTNKGPGPKVS